MPKDGNQTSSCPMWPDQEHQCAIVLTLKYIFSSISLVSCIFVLFLIWLFRHYKNGVQRLILFLTISAFCQSLGFVIGNYHTAGTACAFQGFLIQFFNWATLLWVCSISFHILLHIQEQSPVKYEKWFHLVCWVFPIVFASIPFGGGKYGRSGVWCWIRYDQTALRFGTWYVPKIILILVLLSVFVYILVAVLRRKHEWSGTFNADDQRDKLLLVNEVKPLIALPVIYVVLSIPGIIYRIDDAVRPHMEPDFTLSVLMVIASPSVGAVNAFALAVFSDLIRQLSVEQIRLHFQSHFMSFGGIVHNISVDDSPIVDDIECEDEWGTTITM